MVFEGILKDCSPLMEKIARMPSRFALNGRGPQSEAGTSQATKRIFGPITLICALVGLSLWQLAWTHQEIRGMHSSQTLPLGQWGPSASARCFQKMSRDDQRGKIWRATLMELAAVTHRDTDAARIRGQSGPLFPRPEPTPLLGNAPRARFRSLD